LGVYFYYPLSLLYFGDYIYTDRLLRMYDICLYVQI
jgi:hypothetical protein